MPTVTTSVTELPESRVRVSAEVSAEEVEKRLQQAAKRLGSTMRIPGFRKGKVPPAVVIRRLGRDTVLDEAVRESLGNWYADAIGEAGIAPIGEPELDLSDLPGQGKPLEFSIEIGVRPKATLGEYKGIEVGRREPHVDDAAVDEQIEQLRDRVATLETVDRPAENGDHVVVDYVGTLDGEEFEGGSGRDQLIELGADRLIPGFEQQLVGVSAGDTKTVEVTFPDDYPSEELQGRPATFAVTVHEVKAKQLPELDDDFAAEASEFDTLDELREDFRVKLTEADENAVEREFEQAVLQAVTDNAQVEVPQPLVHARAHELLGQMLHSLEHQGISKDVYLQISGKTEEQLAQEAEPEAEAALRREAVLAAVVEAEQIEPSEQELEEAVAPVAARDGAEPAEIVERLRKGGRLDQLREDVATRQALQRLVAEAKPISVEQAKARDALWTPGKDEPEGEAKPAGAAGGRLWTPGS
ncbi:MAG TPA: trigger factor [Solirubrobacteraceae bacterium]|nr:trigger factor [Solirubrobacteraceae bacterium]